MPAGLCHWPLLALLVSVLVTGCGPSIVDLFEPEWVPNPVPTLYDDRDYATVLRENVRDGLVDYAHLAAHSEPLLRHVGLLGVLGPETTPNLFTTRDQRLAYYLNAYNAAVLRFVLHDSVPETLYDVRLTPFERSHRLRIDGRLRSLFDLRELARAESDGDARIAFCLCEGAKGSPPLQGQPFRADTLSRVIRRIAQDAMDNPNLVRIDHENRRLLIGRAIHRARQDFIDFYRRRTGAASGSVLNVLLQMAGDTRREWLNAAVGYNTGIIPFDRALNKWEPTRAGEK